MEFTKEQLETILKNKPTGTTNDQILADLVKKGATFQGVDMDKARSIANSYQTTQTQVPKEKTVLQKIGGAVEKVADFTGGKELAQGIGQAIAAPITSKEIGETQAMQSDLQGKLIAKIKESKALGKDTSRLEGALADLTEEIQSTGTGAEKLLNPAELTEKQVVGDALQLGTTLASVGSFGGVGAQARAGKEAIAAGKGAKDILAAVRSSGGVVSKIPSSIAGITSGTGIGAGALQGLKTGAMTGGVLGTATGVSQGLQEDLGAGEIAKKGVAGAITGGIAGGALGAVTGAISGGLKGRALRKELLNQRLASEDYSKPILTPKQQATANIAKQQGFNDVDIDFINTMDSTTRLKAQKMAELADKASVNKRLLQRPIDIPGESMLERIKFIENQNKAAAQSVNQAAKALRGNTVDATPISVRAQEFIDDLGVVNKNGKLDFSKSVFRNTPEIQGKLQKFLTEIPKGEADAYDLHIFKKSIDELVNYGTKGEGLKGSSASILKGMRASADDILDSAFDSYNAANTDYKVTREVLDEARDLFGKKAGFSKEKGGQLLRSVFSNNSQRPRVMSLLEKLDETSNAYGKKFDDNLVDQAMFSEILEDVYGTQATTSLQGQTKRAVEGAQRVIAGVRSPLEGALDVAGDVAEKALGVSDEKKRKILLTLLGK